MENTMETAEAEVMTLNETREYEQPSEEALLHTIKLAIEEDKPIMMDYWINSCENTALVGVKEDGEKLLVKSVDEYTSPIDSIYNTGTEYIIVTENSIYLVSSKIDSKRISS